MRWGDRFRQWFFGEKPPPPESIGFGHLVLDAGESLNELVVRLKWSIAAFVAWAAGLWAIPHASEMFLVLWLLAGFPLAIASKIANKPADVRFYEYGLQGSLQSDGGNGWTNPPRTRLLRYDSLVSAELGRDRVLTIMVQDPDTLDRATLTVPVPPSKRSAVESLLPAMRRRPAHLTRDDLPAAPVPLGNGW